MLRVTPRHLRRGPCEFGSRQSCHDLGNRVGGTKKIGKRVLFCEQRARGGRCAQRTRASGIKGRKGAGKEADLRAAGKRRPLRSEDAQGTAGCFGGALRVPLAYPPETAVLSTTRGGWLALVRCRAGAGWRTGAK